MDQPSEQEWAAFQEQGSAIAAAISALDADWLARLPAAERQASHDARAVLYKHFGDLWHDYKTRNVDPHADLSWAGVAAMTDLLGHLFTTDHEGVAEPSGPQLPSAGRQLAEAVGPLDAKVLAGFGGAEREKQAAARREVYLHFHSLLRDDPEPGEGAQAAALTSVCDLLDGLHMNVYPVSRSADAGG